MLVIDLEKCSGCSRCEVNCSFFHTGSVGRSRSRIRVVKTEDRGVDCPVACRHCVERYCLKCPEKALELGEFGQVVVSPTVCVACGACEKLCPVGAIQLYESIPYVCDLCGGDPRCAKACTMEAITWRPELSGSVSLKEFKAGAKGLTPEAKRLRYARKLGDELRNTWKARRAG